MKREILKKVASQMKKFETYFQFLDKTETYFRIWGGLAIVVILVWCQFFNILSIWRKLNELEALNVTIYMVIGTVFLIIKARWLKPIIFFLKRKRRLPYNKNDGGRGEYFNAKANDCAVRGIAIATKTDYMKTYLSLTKAIQDSVDIDVDGVKPRIIRKYLESLGWIYHSFNGKGGKINKNNPNIPKKGTFILDTPGHLTTIVDGVIQDNFNSSEMELSGYFYKEEP